MYSSQTIQRILNIIAIIIPVAILVAVFSHVSDMTYAPDSKSYTNFANDILSGELFQKKDLAEVRFGRAVRTPGYPLLIAIAKSIFSDESQAIFLLHLVCAVFSVAFLAIALKPYCPPIITGFSVVVVQVLMREYFALVMTEWIALNILLFLFGLIVIACANPTNRNLFVTGLVSSFAVLVRPSLAPVLLLMPALIVYRRHLKLREGFLLALTIIPILMWMSFNLYYLGAFKLGHLAGHTTFAIGSIIGHAQIEPGDSVELQEFITAVNQKKIPKPGTEDAFVDDLKNQFNMMMVERNLFWIAYPLRDESKGVIYFDREFLDVYGRRAMHGNFGNYLKYIAYGMTLVINFGSPYLVIYLLAIPLLGIYRGKNRELSLCAVLMFFVYIGNGLVCAVSNLVFDRYLVPTFYAYLVSVTACFVGLVYAERWHEPILKRLPRPLSFVTDHFLRLS